MQKSGTVPGDCPAFFKPYGLLGLGLVLFDDPYLERHEHAFAEIDLGVVLADFLELVGKVELAALDLDAAVGLDRREEIGSLHAAVEGLAVLLDLRGNRDGKTRQLRGKLLGLGLAGGALGGALRLELGETAAGSLRHGSREPLGKEHVARIAGGDLDDLAGLAEELHIGHEHNFCLHDVYPLLKP